MAIGRSSIAHGAGPTSITLMTCVRPVRARSTGFSTRGRACGRSRWAWLCSPPTPAIRLGALLIDEGTVNGPRQLPRVRQAADPVKPELLRFMIGCRISNRRLPVWSEHSSPAAIRLGKRALAGRPLQRVIASIETAAAKCSDKSATWRWWMLLFAAGQA
jgi:hypothetical protein